MGFILMLFERPLKPQGGNTGGYQHFSLVSLDNLLLFCIVTLGRFKNFASG